MGAGDYQVVGDPSELESIWVRNADNMARIQGALASLTEDHAINASNFSRLYLTPSLELVAAVGQTGIPFDSPMLAEIVEQERDTAWAPLRAAESFLKGTVRTTFGAFDAMIDSVKDRPLRFLYQLSQGEDFGAAVDKSGAAPLTMAIEQMARGEDVAMGSGWVHSETDPWENEEFRQELFRRMGAAIQAGQGQFDRVYDQTLADMQDQLPVDVVRRAWQIASSNRYTVTLPDGSTETTPITLGTAVSNRLADVGGLEIIRPNTAPATLFSGSIDAWARVAGDPLNIPADAVTDAMRASKYVLPAAGKGLGKNIASKQAIDMSNDWRWWVSPKTADKWRDSRAGDKTLRRLAETKSETEIDDILHMMPIHTRRAVKNIDDPARVYKVLEPELGVRSPLAPKLPFRYTSTGSKVLGARVTLDKTKGAAGGAAVYADETRLGKLFRREAAEQTGGSVVLDPNDIDGSIHSARQLMDTIGATKQETDRVLDVLMNSKDRWTGVKRAVTQINIATRRRLIEVGYDAVDADEIMRQLTEVQMRNHLYNTDLVGNHMANMDEGYLMIPDGKGGETVLYKPNAVTHDSRSRR
jgi:hypothetical protein